MWGGRSRGGASGRTIFRFFASGKEEIQPSRSENGRMSESERTKKKKPRDISGCEHLDSARAAEVSDGRQREQAVAHLSSTHSIILLFFFSPPPAFSPRSGGDSDPSAATI